MVRKYASCPLLEPRCLYFVSSYNTAIILWSPKFKNTVPTPHVTHCISITKKQQVNVVWGNNHSFGTVWTKRR
jgi:hypothetical protein